MNSSRRIVLIASVFVGLSIAAVTGAVSVRVADIVDENSRARRETIGRRAVGEVAAVSLAALGSVLIVGWIGVLEARRRTGGDSTAQAKYREAVGARMDALRRERQARAEADQASQFKDEFLATVSHELRTPLNAIVGWTHVLKDGKLTGRDRERAIDAVDRNASAMTRLVNDLLDVSRLMQGRLNLSVAPLDLRDIARGVVDTLATAAAAKNLTVTLRLGTTDVPVAGDEARLQQATWHLLSNAVKFTPAGGFITVEVWRLGGRAQLRVSDSGEGIDADMLPHVFESFRRSRHIGRTGLGVGLAIVRQLAELHGGAIDVESPGPGRGAVFTLTLPLGGRSAPRGATPQSASRHRRASLGTVS
ncbi:MAG TPA: HAMP domain-containing sensor histidine kinase [Vicinamibacterales bacterium]|nr:HAMP domain-containing sensor histidine kinase [Vicinamibacterales bacterium]